MSVETKYLYKVFRNGVYLGLLPNVTSKFEYTQEINTGATDITVRVAEHLDTASEPVVELTDENGNILTTEQLQTLTTERSLENIGDTNSSTLIANDNDIEVWEFTNYNPDGALVFTGYIETWESYLSKDSYTDITVVSYGIDLDDYVYGNSNFTSQASFVPGVSDEAFLLGNSSQLGTVHLGSSVLNAVFQTFTGYSFELTKLVIFMYCETNPATATVSIYSGSPDSGTYITSTTIVVSNTTSAPKDILLPSGIVLSAATTYYIKIQASDYLYVNGSDASGYAGGSCSIQFTPGGVIGTSAIDDLDITLYSGGAETDAEFTGWDPGNMVTDAMAGYNGQGGIVSYVFQGVGDPDDTVVYVNYLEDYTFRLATVLEIIQKALELAPSDWYWFVDVATQILYWKEVETTPTHLFTLGNHITELYVGATKKDITNIVYFTGGPTAGVNLLKLYTDPDSLAVNRRGMKKLTDNRIVTANESAAETLSNSFMDENSTEVFRGEIEILANTYDISTIKLGETVGLRGFNSFVNSIVFQITKVRRGEDYIYLTLGKLPTRSDAYIDRIKRDLDKEQTLENPSTPS